MGAQGELPGVLASKICISKQKCVLLNREELGVQTVADKTGRDVWYSEGIALEASFERPGVDPADPQQRAWQGAG